jgi:hypothetical protein
MIIQVLKQSRTLTEKCAGARTYPTLRNDEHDGWRSAADSFLGESREGTSRMRQLTNPGNRFLTRSGPVANPANKPHSSDSPKNGSPHPGESG